MKKHPRKSQILCLEILLLNSLVDRRSTWAFYSFGKAKAHVELREKTSGAFTLA